MHLEETFEVPRPRALLGQAHFDRLAEAAQHVISLQPDAFRTLRLSAAGADSVILQRLRHELAGRLRLEPADTGGDLLLALRRRPGGQAWQVLIRTTPRPLSARPWRVCDMPGALNATAAFAMVKLSEPMPDETFVNIACGSATLLIERLHLTSAGRAIGYDTDVAALDCARANIAAAGVAAEVHLQLCDARQLPLESGSVRTVVADLPYAMLLGSADANRELYPALLREAARVLMPGGGCVVVTTQRRLMDALLDPWEILERVPLSVPHARGAINPRIYALRKP